MSDKLTIEEAGMFLCESVVISTRSVDAELHEKPHYTPAPRGAVTCGELTRMSGAVILLALQAYPELSDPTVLEQTIRSAIMRGAGGTMN